MTHLSKLYQGKYKKIKNLFLIASLSCSSLLMADSGNLANVQLGYSANDTESPYINSGNRSGFYVGTDLMYTGYWGFGIGLGLDANAWKAKDATGVYSDGYSMYTVGSTAKVGYSFQKQFDIPIQLKTGYGYGVAWRGDKRGSGAQYESSVEYTVFEDIGFGVKYKRSKASIGSDTTDTEVKSIIGYFYFGTGW